jgi:hypothetical protein
MFSLTYLRSSSGIVEGENGATVYPAGEVHQSLLTLGENIKILVDVGWDSKLESDLDFLAKYVCDCLFRLYYLVVERFNICDN